LWQRFSAVERDTGNNGSIGILCLCYYGFLFEKEIRSIKVKKLANSRSFRQYLFSAPIKKWFEYRQSAFNRSRFPGHFTLLHYINLL